MNNFMCPKCGGFLEYKTTFAGGPKLSCAETEIYCDRCHIHIRGDAVPREKTEDELNRLYKELKNKYCSSP